MNRRSLYVAVLVGMLSPAAGARVAGQLAAPGASGIAMGHIHLAVHDLEAHRRFWAAFGGTPVQNGALQLIQFPGTFVMLRQAEPTAGTVGSTINHFGFQVKSIQEWMPKWQAAGLKMEPITGPARVYLVGPDDVRVEILEDASIDVPLKMHHLHFYLASPIEAQLWYAKTFGAVPGKRGQNDAADLPGVNLTFTKADAPMAGTKGRSLDHIGFEVKNLPEFLKRMEAEGVNITQGLTASNFVSTMRVAFITDPWGTKMEITEGIAP